MMRKACLMPAALGLFLVFAPANAEAPAASVPQPGATGIAENPRVLTDAELSDFRGGQAIMIADQTLTSIVSNPNIGGNVSTGMVNLSDNALSNFNGLGNLVINTGSQVSVQSGMNVIVNVNQ